MLCHNFCSFFAFFVCSVCAKKWKCYIENHTSSFAPFVRRPVHILVKNGISWRTFILSKCDVFIINVRLILRKIFIHIIYILRTWIFAESIWSRDVCSGCVCVCDCECARLGPGVCSIHMQIVHIKSFLLHLNDNNVYNNNNNIRTHIIW